ncbi:hypothetical protein DMP17_22135 [Pseudonocardia sp. TMWB2A]|uniref:phage portal protein family protein n=1 Tax=Pseudonocardia sp. TMWB2A TaxID=687430 RepID=UPI00307E9D76
MNAVPTAELGSGQVNSAAWWGGIEEKTPELQWPNNVRIYDQMRRTDTQVQSVMRAVTMPVRRTSWRIAPNGARDEVVAQVAEDLGLPIDGADPAPLPRSRDRFSWTEHLRMALLQLVFGHMPFEQVCRIDERGRVRLRKLAPRMPATISEFDVARDGGLRSLVQDPPASVSPTDLLRYASPARAVRIPVERLVMYSNDREGGNWQGQSMLRPAYKFWLLKDRMLRVQAMSVDRNGMGMPLYTGAPREDLKKGLEMATNWRSGEAAGAAVPNGADLKLRGVEGDLPDADKVIRYYDEQIARGALLHFLNLGTQTGSWALGSTFAEFFTMSLQTVADDVKAVVNQHVIEDLVDWNWSIDERAPLLICDEIGSRNPATAEAIKALIDCGAILPDRELEEAVRQRHGLPPKGNYSKPAGPAPAPEPGQRPQRRAVASLLRDVIAELEDPEPEPERPCD